MKRFHVDTPDQQIPCDRGNLKLYLTLRERFYLRKSIFIKHVNKKHSNLLHVPTMIALHPHAFEPLNWNQYTGVKNRRRIE